ncbi:hypothetical protein PCCS19_40160 [Paenibacillus sp. CCS19]|uniref:hypothetical protein n=1 Tax=Paenibacillus sp. CCS19 TaxID=3158387 RepID=UPI00256A2219|nr:hypothetical protein [Paenibacillus cellulosilyticus]GMK40960.1 hypothetical protein PCCS19_40160 [Paenibacillus cellulosilyticus]
MFILLLNTDDLAAMDNEALIKLCFQPLITRYKEQSAQDGNIALLFESFEHGEKALFAVWTFLTHAIRGTDEFHWRCLLFLHIPARFTGMQAGLRMFGDAAMSALLDDIHAATAHLPHRGEHAITMNEAQSIYNSNCMYAASILALEARLVQAMPETIRLIAAYIRGQVSEFSALRL